MAASACSSFFRRMSSAARARRSRNFSSLVSGADPLPVLLLPLTPGLRSPLAPAKLKPVFSVDFFFRKENDRTFLAPAPLAAALLSLSLNPPKALVAAVPPVAVAAVVAGDDDDDDDVVVAESGVAESLLRDRSCSLSLVVVCGDRDLEERFRLRFSLLLLCLCFFLCLCLCDREDDEEPWRPPLPLWSPGLLLILRGLMGVFVVSPMDELARTKSRGRTKEKQVRKGSSRRG